MKVLVLGASGLIGNAIVRELIQQGHEVTGTGRAALRPKNLEGLELDFSPGNIDAEGQLEQWVAGQDAVIDAAAPYFLNLLSAANEAERRPLNYAGSRTDKLIRAVRGQGAKLMLISTSLTEPPDESGSLSSLQSRVVRNLYPYFAAKKLMEERLLDAAEQGLDVVIVRPTACIGPWDIKPREQCWIAHLLNGEIPAVLRHRINVIDSRDLASAVATLAAGKSNGCTNGRTITVAGHNSTTDELLAALCRAGGVRAPQWGIPAALSIVPLLWTELMWAALGTSSPLPSLVPALLCEQRWLDPGAVQGQPGRALRPLAETAEATVGWYREMGYC